MSKEITYDELHKRFIYLSVEGLLINKKTRKIVGSFDGKNYLRVNINKKAYLLHRIVYCMYHGYFPENDIDHINRNKRDNRICNLREVSRSCNLRNTGNSCRNTSGIKGISWDKSKNRWRVSIRYNNKSISVGTFKNFINAVKARHYAEQKCSYHSCDYKSPAAEYLNNLKMFSTFETNINIEEQKEKNKVENEWKYFCYTGKVKLDSLINDL